MNTLPIAFIQNLNAPEIILIFLVVLLLFGAKRLPELSRSFGKSIKEFKRATTDIQDEVRTAMEEEPKPAPTEKVETKSAPVEPTEVTEPNTPSKETETKS